MLRLSVLKCNLPRTTFKLASSYSAIGLKNKITVTDDESTFIIWHPPEDFPYECTKPLPEQKCVEDTSVLKVQAIKELQTIFNKKTPEQARQELMSITHTTKHRWFHRPRDKKAKKTPMDREYL